MKKLLFIMSLLVISSQAYAGQVSYDQLAISSDLTVSKYNSDLNTLYQDHNNNVQSSNLLDDTIDEADFADNSNPRIRTYEGASCEKVDDGLLTTTTSGTLTGSVPVGTAYPRGFRCDKTSSTPKTFTATKWTFVDIDSSCNFQYSEVAIDAATPSVAANSIRLSRVSTDGTQIGSVQDLRTTNCTSGPFEDIADASGEADLDDMFAYGTPVRNRGTGGIAQGAFISYDALTTFTVTSGSIYINGKFRRNTSNLTVPQTSDAPTSGTSGIDTGSIASGRYNVFAVADQDAVKTFSVSYSVSPTPGGVTNYRKIGEIMADSGGSFTSTDILMTHGVQQKELVGAWIRFDGTGTVATQGSYNVSGLADNATGKYTISWAQDFSSATNYVVGGMAIYTGAFIYFDDATAPTVGAIKINVADPNNTFVDSEVVGILAIGDR